MMLSSSRPPSAPMSSAIASAPGTTWMAGCPPPSRLPSSTSSATPAVAFTKVASSGSALPPWPSRVAVARERRSCMASARRRFSGSALPATIAPIVSRSTSRAPPHRGIGQALDVHRLDERGEPVEVVRHRGRAYPAPPAMGATGPVRARYRP